MLVAMAGASPVAMAGASPIPPRCHGNGDSPSLLEGEKRTKNQINEAKSEPSEARKPSKRWWGGEEGCLPWGEATSTTRISIPLPVNPNKLLSEAPA